MKDLIKLLFEKRDEKYKMFNDKIVNTKLKTIGVRMPVLKRIAKEISVSNPKLFLNKPKSEYYEVTLIEGLVISYVKDPLEMLEKLNKYMDKIDNWGVCDTVCASCKNINKIKDETILFIKKNLLSSNVWRVRFSFVLLLDYFVEKKYLNMIFNFVDKDKNDFYYVMMAKAWLISECFIKYRKETFNYLKRTNIDSITYNKAISKICDSYRVSKSDKIALRQMKKLTKNA